MNLNDREAAALRAALDNEIDTWSVADCGESQAENDAWVATLRDVRNRLNEEDR